MRRDQVNVIRTIRGDRSEIGKKCEEIQNKLRNYGSSVHLSSELVLPPTNAAVITGFLLVPVKANA